MTNNQDFIAYEYLQQTVPVAFEAAFTDGYENFGWQLDKRSVVLNQKSVHLQFKRDRRIDNKVELNRLQRQFDEQMAEVVQLNRQQVAIPTVIAITVGLLGTVFMGVSVFAYLAAFLVLSIVVAVPGFLLWGASYFVYRWYQRRITTRMQPSIEERLDQTAATCQSAFTLSH